MMFYIFMCSAERLPLIPPLKTLALHHSCFPRGSMSVRFRTELRAIYLKTQWFKISFGAAHGKMFPPIVIFHCGFKGSCMESAGRQNPKLIVFTCVATFIGNMNNFIWSSPEQHAYGRFEESTYGNVCHLVGGKAHIIPHCFICLRDESPSRTSNYVTK